MHSDDPEVGPLVGNFTATQALDTLLRDTRFDYRVVDSRTIAVVRRAAPGIRRYRPRASRNAARPAQRPESVASVTGAGRAQRADPLQLRCDVFLPRSNRSRKSIVTGSRIQTSRRHVVADAGDRDERVAKSSRSPRAT